ncbi:hypothetical protein CSB37_03675 [bacterium DOLZORAL124_38_8]|nr:MAG: hypothetical protein CSB37_03675 [bacterium DOLZORAL124_38_8]
MSGLEIPLAVIQVVSPVPAEGTNLEKSNQGALDIQQIADTMRNKALQPVDTIPNDTTKFEKTNILPFMYPHNLHFAKKDTELLSAFSNMSPEVGVSCDFLNGLFNLKFTEDYKKFEQSYAQAEKEFKVVDRELKSLVQQLKGVVDINSDEEKINWFHKITQEYKALLKVHPELRTYEEKFNDFKKYKSYFDYIKQVEVLSKHLIDSGLVDNADSNIFLNKRSLEESSVKKLKEILEKLKGKFLKAVKENFSNTKELPGGNIVGESFVGDILKLFEKVETIDLIQQSGEKLTNTAEQENVQMKLDILSLFKYLRENFNLDGIGHHFATEGFDSTEALNNAQEYAKAYTRFDGLKKSEYLTTVELAPLYELLIKMAHVEHMQRKQEVSEALEEVKDLFKKGKKQRDISELTWKQVMNPRFQRVLAILEKYRQYNLDPNNDTSVSLDKWPEKYLSPKQLTTINQYVDRVGQMRSMKNLAAFIKQLKRTNIFDGDVEGALETGLNITVEQKNEFVQKLINVFSWYGSEAEEQFKEDLKENRLDDEFDYLASVFQKLSLLFPPKKAKELLKFREIKDVFKSGEEPGKTTITWENAQAFYNERHNKQHK